MPSENMKECSCWAELPLDVVQHLVLHLKTNDFCALRLASRNWASCSRQITTPPMVIPSSQASLSVKIATLAAWRQAGRFTDSEFSFQTDKPMSGLELSETTQALTKGCLTNCRILVKLEYAFDLAGLYPVSEYWEQQLEDAHRIAETAQHLLDENRVELRITINRRSQNAMLPAPQVIHALKRFLSAFDTYSIPTEQSAASLLEWTEECSSKEFSCYHSQVTALKDSSFQVCTVQTECDLDWDPDVFESWCYDGLIAAVATMTHLTKLHLSLADYFDFSAINLEPLACLTSLEDLALQCFDNPGLDCLRMCDSVCCQGVLKSNKQTLHCVTLTGPWTAATYYMLHKCSKVETLSISISELDVDQAKALASISADSFRLTLHQQLEPIVLAAINHSQPQIHMLTSWGTYQKEALKMPQLLSLQELTLVNFVPFTIVSRIDTHDSDVGVVGIAADSPGYRPVTGEAFECCPMVTKLTLIDCPGISSKGLKYIIEKAMPALQTLSIQATMKPDREFLGNCARIASFDADGLHALCLGSSLCSIDLRGVSGLTTEALLLVRLALLLKQCQGDAPSSIDLLLPHAACLDKAVFSLITTRSMFLPNILRSSDCGEVEQVVF